MLIYRQMPQTKENQLVCKVPIFMLGANACDTGKIGHCDLNGRCGAWHLMIIMDRQSSWWLRQTSMENGITLYASGSWHGPRGYTAKWSRLLARMGEPGPSTGRRYSVYGNRTSIHLHPGLGVSKRGNLWVVCWSCNWETGQTEWLVRTGAGGTYNSEARGNLLVPDGTLYQGVLDGIVAIKEVY